MAWLPLGWKAAWLSEIDPFSNAVLAHHYPSTPNLGDIRRIREHDTFQKTEIDLLVGGTPCQGFSLAGKREGMDDDRSQLAVEFLKAVDVKHPQWVLWENVVGALSTGQGRDFGAFVWKLQELGYGVCWRVLDAKNFGVPQQRRRIFVVGHTRDWRPATAVLFGKEDLRWNFEESERKRENPRAKAGKVTQKNSGPIGVEVYNYVETGDVAATLGAGCGSKNSHGPKILDANGIRLPTPVEAERLMGFPDGYTAVPFKSKNTDQLRYKALGNSIAVPVMRWIGGRIQTMDEILAGGG